MVRFLLLTISIFSCASWALKEDFRETYALVQSIKERAHYAAYLPSVSLSLRAGRVGRASPFNFDLFDQTTHVQVLVQLSWDLDRLIYSRDEILFFDAIWSMTDTQSP